MSEEDFKSFLSAYFNKNDDKITLFNLDDNVIEYFKTLIETNVNEVKENLKKYRLKNDDIELSELNPDIISKIENNEIDISILKNLMSDDDNNNIDINALSETLQLIKEKVNSFTVNEGTIEDVKLELNEYTDTKINDVQKSLTKLSEEISNSRKNDIKISINDLDDNLKETFASNSNANTASLDSLYRRKDIPVEESDLGVSLQAKLKNVTSNIYDIENNIKDYTDKNISVLEENYNAFVIETNDYLEKILQSINDIWWNIDQIKEAMRNRLNNFTIQSGQEIRIAMNNPYAYNIKFLVYNSNENSISYGRFISSEAFIDISLSDTDEFKGYILKNLSKNDASIRMVYSKDEINIEDPAIVITEKPSEDLEEDTSPALYDNSSEDEEDIMTEEEMAFFLDPKLKPSTMDL